jgi:hypothetical protein
VVEDNRLGLACASTGCDAENESGKDPQADSKETPGRSVCLTSNWFGRSYTSPSIISVSPGEGGLRFLAVP